jgi:hypothetical protein
LQIAPQGFANKNNTDVKNWFPVEQLAANIYKKISVSLLGSHDRYAPTAFFTA